MHCKACGYLMQHLGANEDGDQSFACHGDGCTRRYVPVRRWWESGTSFDEEDVP